MTHSYFPFGEEQSATPSDHDKFGTYYRDQTTGIDFARNRYYNSTYGAFLTADPYGGSARAGDPGSWNRYAYVGNDPVNSSDPSGMDPNDFASSSCSDPQILALCQAGDFWDYTGGSVGVYGPASVGDTPTSEPSGDPFGNATFTTTALAGNSAPNGTFIEGFDPNGNFTISQTTTCPPNCGSIMGTVDQYGYMLSNALAPVANNPVVNTATNIGGFFVPEYGVLSGLAASTETVTGYRAVSLDEAQSIQDTNLFTPSPTGSEGKYFFFTQQQALDFGNRMYGPGQFQVVQSTFPSTAIPSDNYINPATEGPGFVVPNENLPFGVPGETTFPEP